jgi:adenylate cyclase class IV
MTKTSSVEHRAAIRTPTKVRNELAEKVLQAIYNTGSSDDVYVHTQQDMQLIDQGCALALSHQGAAALFY